MSNFYIQQKGQSEIDLTQRLPSLMYLDGSFTPNFINNYQDNTMTDGSVLTSVAIGRATFTANFFMYANDYTDHVLLRHELYKYFGNRQLLRIRTSDDPAKCFYARPANFNLDSIEQGNNDFKFSIPFEVPSGYMYSVAKSDELKNGPSSFGMNLGTQNYAYVHKENEFVIYNASDVVIDPYFQKHDLKITCNTDGPISLINKTNGTKWGYTGSLSGNTSIVLNGITTFKNGVPDSKNTDYGFIKLETGENHIVVQGAATHEIIFSFPFLYLS